MIDIEERTRMSARLVVGAASFCIAFISIITANAFVTRMIHEINRVKKDDERISDLGFTFPKVTRIFREYRASCPSGRLNVYALGAGALGAAGLLGTAICLRIIG